MLIEGRFKGMAGRCCTGPFGLKIPVCSSILR
jgi:hypothetical protein